MGNLLGKRVFYKGRKYNAYSLDKDDWYEATIVGLFIGGDVLVEGNDKETYRVELESIAFTEELTDMLETDSASTVQPSDAPSTNKPKKD